LISIELEKGEECRGVEVIGWEWIGTVLLNLSKIKLDRKFCF
jgi:hypothetical protein